MSSKPSDTESADAVPLPVKKILVPIDFSECSLFALRYGINLAKQVDASLMLVHVASSLLTPPEMEYVHLDLKKFQAEIEKHTSAKLAEIAQKEIPSTIPTT